MQNTDLNKEYDQVITKYLSKNLNISKHWKYSIYSQLILLFKRHSKLLKKNNTLS